jgi:hypothetical protein
MASGKLARVEGRKPVENFGRDGVIGGKRWSDRWEEME